MRVFDNEGHLSKEVHFLKRLFVYIFYTSSIILSCIGSLEAQVLPKIKFKNINKTNGLSNNNVTAISRDNFGFMWFGMHNGLCRYENSGRMQVLKANEKIKGGLKSSNIASIYIDKKDNIWIGTRLGGLSKYNQVEDSWETFMNNPDDSTSISDNEVLKVLEDNKGNIWVGTENGLNLYNPQSKSFSHFKIDKKDDTALKAKSILSIMEDDKGWIWVGTWEGGLHLLLPSKDGNFANATFRNFNPKEESNYLNVWKIFQDKQKRYWIGTHGDGLYLFQLPKNASNDPLKQNWQPKFHNYLSDKENQNSITTNSLRDIIQDANDRIWIGTVHGLSLINPEELPSSSFLRVTNKKPEIRFEQLMYSSTDLTSLAHDNISSIYEDKQGIIWLGTFSGVSKYNWYNNQFDNYEFFQDKFNTPNTQNIYISPEKIGWLATGSSGVLEYNFTTNEINKITVDNSDMLLDNRTTVVYSSDDVNIYFGSPNGISCYNRETLETTKYPLPEEIRKIASKFTVHTLYEDNFDRIWIGTYRGLFWVHKKTGEYHALMSNPADKSTISDNSISSIYGDDKSYLWITTYNGLNRLTLGTSNDFQIVSYVYDNKNKKKVFVLTD